MREFFSVGNLNFLKYLKYLRMSVHSQEELQKLRNSLRKAMKVIATNTVGEAKMQHQTGDKSIRNPSKIEKGSSSAVTSQNGLTQENASQEIPIRNFDKSTRRLKIPYDNQSQGCSLKRPHFDQLQEPKIKLQSQFIQPKYQNRGSYSFLFRQNGKNKPSIFEQQVFDQETSNQYNGLMKREEIVENLKYEQAQLEQSKQDKKQLLNKNPRRKRKGESDSRLEQMIKRNKHLLDVDFETRKIAKQFSSVPNQCRGNDGRPMQSYLTKIQHEVRNLTKTAEKAQSLLASRQYTTVQFALQMGITKNAAQRYKKIFKDNGGIIPVRYGNKNKTQRTLSQIKFIAIWNIIKEKPFLQHKKIQQLLIKQCGISVPKSLISQIINFLQARKLTKSRIRNINSKEPFINPVFNSGDSIEHRYAYAQKFTKQIIQKNLLTRVLFIQEMVIIEQKLRDFVKIYANQSKKISARVSRNMIQQFIHEDQQEANRKSISLSKYSLMGVLSTSELLQCNAIKGVYNNSVTQNFISEHLCSPRYRGFILVVPNNKKFTSQSVKKDLQQNDMIQMVLPEYYGDLSPMKKMFTQVKNNLIKKMAKLEETGTEYSFPELLQQVVIDLDGNQVAPFISNMKLFIDKALKRERFN